jgi:hypothetical protein
MTSDRLYAALLGLYPKSFRDEYGEEMRIAFSRLRDSSARSHVAFWSFVLADVARSAAIAQLDECRHGSRQIALRLAASSVAGLLTTTAAARGTSWLYGYVYHPYLEGVAIPMLPYGLALGLVLGGTVGITQWLLLPARVRRASTWALASAVALPIAVLFCSAAFERALAGLNPVAAEVPPPAVGFLFLDARGMTTWMGLGIEFTAMAASALIVRALMRRPLMERRHAHS